MATGITQKLELWKSLNRFSFILFTVMALTGTLNRVSGATIIEGTIAEWNFNDLNGLPIFRASSVEVMLGKRNEADLLESLRADDFDAAKGVGGTGAFILEANPVLPSLDGKYEIAVTNLDPSQVLGVSSVSFEIRTEDELNTFSWEQSLPNTEVFLEVQDGIAVDAGLQQLELPGFFEPLQPGDTAIFRIRLEGGNASMIVDNLLLTGTAFHDAVPEPQVALHASFGAILLLYGHRNKRKD